MLWTGPDGVLAIAPYGYATAVVFENSPVSMLPPATTDFETEVAYARDYFVAMGVPACEIASGTIPEAILQRVVDGIPIEESIATAEFDSDLQMTNERLFWPTIPASVVSEAIAFQQRLADPVTLAAFKHKLPADAQGDGQVVIHHSDPAAASLGPIQVLTTYDVTTSGDAGDGDATLSFDANGQPVTLSW